MLKYRILEIQNLGYFLAVKVQPKNVYVFLKIESGTQIFTLFNFHKCINNALCHLQRLFKAQLVNTQTKTNAQLYNAHVPYVPHESKYACYYVHVRWIKLHNCSCNSRISCLEDLQGIGRTASKLANTIPCDGMCNFLL